MKRILGLVIFVTLTCFLTWAAGPQHLLLAATPLASLSPLKLLAVAGSVFAILQAIKAAFPGIDGVWAVALNVVLSVFGVVVLVKPENLFSIDTFTLAAVAAVGAAGLHGTWRSAKGTPAS